MCRDTLHEILWITLQFGRCVHIRAKLDKGGHQFGSDGIGNPDNSCESDGRVLNEAVLYLTRSDA